MSVDAADLVSLPATDLTLALATGRVRSRDLLEAFLDRIQRLAWINAVVTVDAPAARRSADAADAALRAGRMPGPLHGLPITVKHDVLVDGMLSTYGSTDNGGYIADRDSPAVARLRRAGAVVFGRTNLPEYATDGQSYNALHGTTRNPWDPGRTPGGSSGGSAAAVAAGLTGLELGSDMGGSIRIPAAWCGVYGFKPSWGLVPAGGSAPSPDDPPFGRDRETDIAVTGPLARSAADIELAMEVLTGWPAPVAGQRTIGAPEAATGPLRIGVWDEDPRVPASREVQDVFDAACARLERAGHVVTRDIRPPAGLDELAELFELLFMSDAAESFPADVRAWFAAEAAHPDASWLLRTHARALGVSHREWLGWDRRRVAVREEWDRVFSRIDVLLTPTTVTTAPRHDHSEPVEARTHRVDGVARSWRPDLTRWCGAIGVAGLPALAVPLGLGRQGLPVGGQVVGPLWGDRRVLAAARALESVWGGFVAPDPQAVPRR